MIKTDETVKSKPQAAAILLARELGGLPHFTSVVQEGGRVSVMYDPRVPFLWENVNDTYEYKLAVTEPGREVVDSQDTRHGGEDLKETDLKMVFRDISIRGRPGEKKPSLPTVHLGRDEVTTSDPETMLPAVRHAADALGVPPFDG